MQFDAIYVFPQCPPLQALVPNAHVVCYPLNRYTCSTPAIRDGALQVTEKKHTELFKFVLNNNFLEIMYRS